MNVFDEAKEKLKEKNLYIVKFVEWQTALQLDTIGLENLPFT